MNRMRILFGHFEEPAPNEAPAPNRRPRFPIGGLGNFEYGFCGPPAFAAAVGEAQRSAGFAS
jgi:hypothetical protein